MSIGRACAVAWPPAAGRTCRVADERGILGEGKHEIDRALASISATDNKSTEILGDFRRRLKCWFSVILTFKTTLRTIAALSRGQEILKTVGPGHGMMVRRTSAST